ncbi:MAG: aspartate dehydrogenase [Chloroflexi bacterium]|nr:aspartate dehydrogenase [Chloroflexota bacterium]MBV9602392.1 aspartate dehydrogenase [Chloroflexota bacterium]
MRVGFIGLGTIARGVLELLQPSDRVDVVGALVAHPNKPRPGCHVRVCTRIEDLLARKPEVVVEAAGHAALRCHGPRVLRAGIDLLILGVGALAEPDTERDICQAARDGQSHAIVVSGGIGGLDAIASASAGHLHRVTHFTRKPARALLPPDEASALTEPRQLFAGNAREGALRFPESINVAAAVSLAGVGLDRTEVRVIADPSLERNRHEVVAEGDFGRLRFEIENVPSADNPRTGRLVAMSVVQALRRRQARLIIG